jgi:nitrite reductase/ring-hydroxylating ferredoxin subunit
LDHGADNTGGESESQRSGGTLRVLCKASEVAADQPIKAELDGFAYAVFRLGESYFITADLCTHGPGCLSEGYIEGEEVECPFHQGRFHIPSGKPTLSPCTEAIRTWTAHLIDGDICIDPAEGAA